MTSLAVPQLETSRALTTAVLTTLAEVDALAAEWRALAARCGQTTVFLLPEWHLTYRRHLGWGELCFVTVRDGERLVGLAPLMTHSESRLMCFHSIGAADYFDVLVEEAEAPRVFSSLFATLRDYARRSVLDLCQIPPNSPLLAWLAAQAPAPMTCRRFAEKPCRRVVLPATWEAYQQTLGKNLRQQLGYYERKLRRAYATEIRLLAPDEVEEGMAALYDLHTERWTARHKSGSFAGDPVRAFHHELAATWQQQGILRLYGIKLDGEWQALLYAFCYRGVNAYYQSGMNPDFSDYRLGKLLIGHAIRDSIEQGCTVFDFLRGTEPYKALWAPEYQVPTRVILAGAAPRAQLAAAAKSADIAFNLHLRALLHTPFALGMKQRWDGWTRRGKK